MNAPQQNRIAIPWWGWIGGLGLIAAISIIPGSEQRFGDLPRIISSFGGNLIIVTGIVAVINIFLPTRLALPWGKLLVVGLLCKIFAGKVDMSGLLSVILICSLFMTIVGLVISILTKSLKGFLMPFKWLGKIFGSGSEKKRVLKFDPNDQVTWAGEGGIEFTGQVEQVLGNGRIRVMGDDGIRRQLQPGDLEKI